MIQNLFGRMSSRREWLRNAGLGASIAVLPAAVTGGAVFGKDDDMQDIMQLIKNSCVLGTCLSGHHDGRWNSSMVDARRGNRAEGWCRRRVWVQWETLCSKDNRRRA